MTGPPLLLVAHGSRSPAADTVVRELVAAAADRMPGLDVRVCYVDVRGPTVGDAVAGLAAHGHRGAVVLPAFLAAGYHVRRDLPARLRAAAADPARFPVTPPLGPDRLLAAAAADRLRAAGHRSGDALVLAAAGSSDPRAVSQVRAAARMLGARTAAGAAVRPRVRVGFAATGGPQVGALVEGLRRSGERRVAVASWLLAPGTFQDRLLACGADVVAAPLGAHPDVVAAVLARYRDAAGSARRAA